MVKKSTLAVLAGVGVLAAIFLNRPKVTAIQREPIPFAVPEPIPQPVPIPFLDVNIAKDFLEQQFGKLYTQTGSTRTLAAETIRQASLKWEELKGNFSSRDSKKGVQLFLNYPQKYGITKEYDTKPIYTPLAETI